MNILLPKKKMESRRKITFIDYLQHKDFAVRTMQTFVCGRGRMEI
jgi:hypothetical protein